MLESIKIMNLALIAKSSVNFGEGFNVLTGETGAGKSLIVDALLFLTGIRADKTLIKSGEDFARVEGVFSVDMNDDVINEILSSIGIENEGTIIISRQFNLNGKNECRVNGEIVTLNIIRKLSSQIIDIFGQNDSQVLLDCNNHLGLLDAMFESSLSVYKQELAGHLNYLNDINNSIKELGGLDKDREQNIQFLKYQIKEIDDANLKVGEEEDLKAKILTMQNSEKIFGALNNAVEVLDGEYSVENAIKTAINLITSVESFDSDLSVQKDRLYSVRYELQDIVDEIVSRRDGVVYSEQELDIMQDRLMEIKDLERKYGNTIDDILHARDVLYARLEKLLNADAELERLRLNKQSLLKKIYDVCIELHNVRQRESVDFVKRLLKELKSLGMKNADFKINYINDIVLDDIENMVNENGADRIEFLFSANLGVEPRPLDKIISGGEMSRFMLTFKSLQNSNSKKTCIFDEIDAGIGGEIGVEVGKKICEISRKTQVICITHLAQIACFGDNNYLIEKYEDKTSTITSVNSLISEEKIKEIARMLGSSSSETSMKLAKDIINDAEGYKAYLNRG